MRGRGEVHSFANYMTPYKILLHGLRNTLVYTVGFQTVAICFYLNFSSESGL